MGPLLFLTTQITIADHSDHVCSLSQRPCPFDSICPKVPKRSQYIVVFFPGNLTWFKHVPCKAVTQKSLGLVVPIFFWWCSDVRSDVMLANGMTYLFWLRRSRGSCRTGGTNLTILTGEGAAAVGTNSPQRHSGKFWAQCDNETKKRTWSFNDVTFP